MVLFLLWKNLQSMVWTTDLNSNSSIMTLIQRWKHPEPTLQILILRILTPFAGLLDELICIFSFTLFISSFKYQTICKKLSCILSIKSNSKRNPMNLQHKKCNVCGVEKTLNFFQLKKGFFTTTCSWCESQKILKQLKLK